MKKIILNLFIITFIIGTFDFIYTKVITSQYFSQKLGLSKQKKDLSKYYKKNKLGKTVLKENLDNYFIYNKNKYRVCTDKNGFRNFCKKKEISEKLGTVFTGDSLLFGNGIDIEKTFFGIINKNFSNTTNVADENSGLRDSFNKIRNLLELGFKIDEVVYFFDISDIQDESIYQKSLSKKKVNTNKIKKSNFNLNQFKIFLKYNFSLTNNFLLNIKYYYLPKPIYRYKFDYERSAWTYNLNSTGYEPLGVDNTIENFLLTLEDFFLYLKMKNIKLSIVVLPWPNQILYDDLKNSKHARITNSFCQNKCFKLADLYPTIDSYVENNGKKKTIKDVYLKGDMHLSELGHKLIAGHLMNSLMLNN